MQQFGKKENDKDILVSVWCVTYNQVKFIENAINGFLMQRTDFNYKIVIYDDASTDGTSEVLLRYKELYPDIIDIYISSVNTYQSSSRYEQMQELYEKKLQSKYIACCEGDDYWCDPYKLQKQVHFMEEHLDCMMVVHGAKMYNIESGEMDIIRPYTESRYLSSEEIIMQYQGNIPNASMMVKKELYKFERFYYESGVGDWTMQLRAILKGDVYYIDEQMSVYTVGVEGSWTQRMEGRDEYNMHCMRMIVFLSKYCQLVDEKIKVYVITRLCAYISNIVSAYGLDEQKKFLRFKNKMIQEFPQHKSIINEINRIFWLSKDEKYLDLSIKEFILNKKKIYIMGIGKYGSLVAKQLKENKVELAGFVVSHKQQDIFMGKTVFEISEIQMEENDGIIIGINPIIWNEIKAVMDIHHINNYICPFLFDEKVVYTKKR